MIKKREITMECTAKTLYIYFQTILLWLIILPFMVTSENNSEMLFEGQSFLQHNLTEMSNSERFGTDCQIQLWFKPTKRQGIIVVFAGDGGTWAGIALKDGYLRSFVAVDKSNQSNSSIPEEPVTMVTMNQWSHLSVKIHNTTISYSLLGRLNNFTGTLNHRTGFGLIYVGGVPVAWSGNVEASFQNFTGFIKELIVGCKANASDSPIVNSTIKSASFRCHGTCNLSRTITANREKSIFNFTPFSTSNKSPSSATNATDIPKKPKTSITANTTQSLGFLNDSLAVNKIDIVMPNPKRSPPQKTASASGIAKIYKVTVILIIFLFAAVSVYVLGMIIKNKVQQYRTKLRGERQLDMGMASNESLGGAGRRNSLNSNRASYLCDIETGTNINEQQTNRFWRERGERLTVKGNQLRMSASTQSLMSNLNDMESGNVRIWREERKKGNHMGMSSSTYSLSSRRSSAPVCESNLFVTPRLMRKREGASSKDIPRVVLTSAQDDKVIIKRENLLKNTQGRATNTFININGKIPGKSMMGGQSNEQERLRVRGKNKSPKSSIKNQGCELKPNTAKTRVDISYKWAYIRPDSETECSENERMMRQPSRTNRYFDAPFRPCSLRILETNESEEEEDDTCHNKSKTYDEFQTFRCRSSDNICQRGETLKISYDPSLSSSQGERLVCFGIHSASSDPSVISSSRTTLMCDCSMQPRLYSSYHDNASVGSEWNSRQHLDAFLDSFLYNISCPSDNMKNNIGISHLDENDGCRNRQPQLDNRQSFKKTKALLADSTQMNVPKIPSPPPPPPLPPSPIHLQQEKRQQLQQNKLPSFSISNETQNNVIGQRGRLLRQPRVELPIPRPYSSCNFTRTDDDEDLYHPIRMAHASSCDSIPRWVVTPASSKNSNESVDDISWEQQFCSKQVVSGMNTQRCEKPTLEKSRDIPVVNSNGLNNSAQKAKTSFQEIAQEASNQAFRSPKPDSLRDVTVANANGLKNPWILRPNVLSRKNEHGVPRTIVHTKQQGNRWHPRQGGKTKSPHLATANTKDGEGERKVCRRSSWASGNRPSEFELALKGTVPVKRPPSNTSVILKVPGSRTRPQSETMF